MNSIGNLLRLPATRLTATVYAVAAIILSQIPLFNYLGYEFSAVFGIVGGLAAGLLTISFFRREFNENTQPSVESLKSLAARAIAVHALLLLVPLILISLNAFFVKNCSFLDGLVFFLLIPCVTVVFAVGLGIGTAVWCRRPILWYLLLSFLILLHPVFLIFALPQLFAYDFYFGYFPGFSYDEVLRVTTPMVLFRLFTLVAAATLYAFATIAAEHTSRSEKFPLKLKSLRNLLGLRPRSILTLAGLIILTGAFIFRSELGFESSAGYIQGQLGGRHTTAHFTIYYPRELSSDRVKWLAAEHELRYLQVDRVLRANPQGRIESYIYPTAEVKRSLIGTSTTSIAKPWLRQVHLTLESFESSFRHELVHVLAGEYGIPILRISRSPGLIEGLAVAIDWNAGDRTPHEIAAALMGFGLVKDIRGLFTFSGFAAKPSSVSYLLAGSFCRFLMEEYGVRRFTALYRYGGFEGIYRQSLDDLIDRWRGFLETLEVPPTDEARAKMLFVRPSIFFKVCARKIAELNERATKLFREKNYAEASDVFQLSYSLSRNRDARLGFIAAQFRLGKHETLISEIEQTLEDSTWGPSSLSLTLGDCYWILGQQTKSKALYTQLRQMDLAEPYNEACAIRLQALEQPRLDRMMRSYLAGDDSTRLTLMGDWCAKNPSDPVGSYLLGKILIRRDNYVEGIAALSNSRIKFHDPILNFEKEKTLGLAHLRLKKFQEAKIHFWQSLNYTKSRGEFNLIGDFIEVCDWMQNHWEVFE
jgi:tetratricopeptide (TPR) repeat protein